MKKQCSTLIMALACLMLFQIGSRAQLALPGTNLGNTLESTWGYPAPTKALIDAMHNAGFKTVRVPCAWYFNSTNGTINSSYMTQVTNVVNWAIADGMYVVINDHWDTGWFSSADFSSYNSTLNTQNVNLWTQVANNFKNTSSTQLLFACTNEPNANNQTQTTVLYQYYQNWINAIRANGGNNATRWLVLQGPGCNIDNTCAWGTSMPSDSAHKLMMEVHDYDPYQFTLMDGDQSWGAMFYFWGNGYHSSTLTSRNATWGEESYFVTEFNKMKTNFKDRGYPVLMGEWRAEPKGSHSDLTGSNITLNYDACTYWDKYFENLCAQYGFYATAWDTPGQIFDWTTGAVKDQTQINALLGVSAVPPPGSYSSGISNGNHAVVPQNATGARLDAYGWSGANQTKVEIWNGGTQTWAFTNRGIGIYQIAEAWNTSACLDVYGFGGSGTNVNIWACSGSSNQQWGAISDGGSIYEFEPQHALGTRLDVAGGANTNGTQIDIYTKNSQNNQKWAIN